MQSKFTCAIIIPAFNEQNSIAGVIAEIKKQCLWEIVVIDDGSSDDTALRAREAGAKVIGHPFNLGYGVALQTGYKYCVLKNYDFVLQMDADGQHDPRCIADFFKQIQAKEYDVIIGSRFLADDAYRAGTAKLWAIWLFRWIIRMIGGQNITDPTSGYQCLSKKVYQLFTHDSFPYDYPDANVVVMLLKNGYRVKEIPVKMFANPAGSSMHKGVFTVVGYFMVVLLSIFITLIRSKSFYEEKNP